MSSIMTARVCPASDRLAATALALVFLTTSADSLAAAPPTAAYDFDAGAGGTLADRSGNGYAGTLVNGPTWTDGKYNGGLAFDGANDYVTIGDVAQTDGLTAVTVSAWVKFAVAGGGAAEAHFVDKSQCNGAVENGPWELGVSFFGTHKAEFAIYPQGGNPASFVVSGPGLTSIDDGAWHYVTGRYDGANVSIWVDGNLESSRAAPGLAMSNTVHSVQLGGHCSGNSYPFKGTLDDVRIYGRALSQSEIAADMATPVGNGVPPSPPPPVDTTAPSTPTSLAASGVTTFQVTLWWQASTDNVGVAGYRVYRNGSLVGTTASTGFTNSGLASNTSYVFAVAAFDAAGNASLQSAPLAVTTLATPSGRYSTDFPALENPLSEGGKWTTGKVVGLDWNDPVSAGGKAHASVRSGETGNRYDDSIAHLSASFLTFNENQYAEATVYRAPGYAPSGSKHEVELLLRFQITAHSARGYEVLWGWDGDFAIVRWNGPSGDYTAIYSDWLEQLVDGDVVRAEIVGGVIRVYKNGVLKATGPADGTWTNGQPGIGFWPVDSSTPSSYGWRTYAAGNL